MAQRAGLYIEIVPNGIPFLPHPAEWLAAFELERFDVRALAPSDVAVSKLKRFAAHDRGDIEALVAGGHITHAEFVERFKTAVEWLSDDAQGEALSNIVANFHEVERDFFGLRAQTPIDLPTWLGED